MGKPIAHIHITLYDSGNVQVEAPMADKIICYGLLEQARQLIEKMPSQRPPAVVGVGAPLAGLKGS